MSRFCGLMKFSSAHFLWLAPFLMVTNWCGAENPTTAIKVDQVGYLTDGPKVALVSAPAESFSLKRTSDNSVVFQSKLEPGANDLDSGDRIRAADFSAVHAPGRSYIAQLEFFPLGRTFTPELTISPCELSTASAAVRRWTLGPNSPDTRIRHVT